MPRSQGSPNGREHRISTRSQKGRSSERLKKKGLRKFSLPDKAEILANLVPEGTPSKNYRHLRPRKLVNEYVGGRNRYNNPDGIDLYDDDPLSDFVADDDENDLQRGKPKRSRKPKETSSSEWENSEDIEYSEGSAISESDDVLDDTVLSEESIDSEDEDGEPAVDVLSDDDDEEDDDDDGKSASDAESVSSTEEFLQKRKKKSLKTLPKRVTSSTWWKTNKEPSSKSTRKRRAQRRSGAERKSNNSDEEPSRPAKHKKRRSTISDDEDDDVERASSSSNKSKTRTKVREKKRRPKAKRTPVIDEEDEEDDTDNEKESFASARHRQSEDNSDDNSSSQNLTPNSGGEKEKGENSTDDEDKSDDPTSSNENNGESPIVARGKRRKSKQVSSDETETEILVSSRNTSDSKENKDSSHSSPDENASLSQTSSSDIVISALPAKLHRRVLDDEDGDSSNLEGNDIDELNNSIVDTCEQNSAESSGASKAINIPPAPSNVANEVENGSKSNASHVEPISNKGTESKVLSSSKDGESNKAPDETTQRQIELVSDQPDEISEVCIQMSSGTDKEMERTGQELPESEADQETALTDIDKEKDEAGGNANIQVSRDESVVNTASDSSKTSANESTLSSTTVEGTGSGNIHAVGNKTKETAITAEDGFESDDSIVECPVPPKTPPPEITLSSDDEEPVSAATTLTASTTSSGAAGMFHGSFGNTSFGQYQGFAPSFRQPTTVSSDMGEPVRANTVVTTATGTSAASGMFHGTFGNNNFNQFQGFGPSFGRTTMGSQFQQNSAATSSIAEALSRSSSSISSNPFGQVLSGGYTTQRNNSNDPHQQGSTYGMSCPASGNQVSNFSATSVLNNIIGQSSVSRRSSVTNAGQRQPAQNQAWRSWSPQVSTTSQHEPQMAAGNTSGYPSQAFSQAQRVQRMTMMSGTSTRATGNHPMMQAQNTRMTVSSSQIPHSSGALNRTIYPKANSSSSTQQFQRNQGHLLSVQSWGRTPNTVKQTRGQTWGRTPNSVQVGSRFSGQNISQTVLAQMRSNNSNQRFQQSGRLEILNVSDNRLPNSQNNQERNRLQLSRGSVQPNIFANQSSQGNRQKEQRSHLSSNPFSSHIHSSYNQQPYATSSSQSLPNRTPVQTNFQTGGSGLERTAGFRASSNRHASSALNHPQNTGFSNNFGLERQRSASGDNQASFPAPGSNGVVASPPVQGAPFQQNIHAIDRLKMLRNRMQQQLQQQNVNQRPFGATKVTNASQTNQWNGFQHSAVSNACNQLPQNVVSNSINGSSSASSSPPIRPCSFQGNSMMSCTEQLRPDRYVQQQPIVTSCVNNNAQSVQLQGRIASYTAATNLPPSVTQASATAAVPKVAGTQGSMGYFMQETYQHLHERTNTFEKACTNVQENQRALRKIQDEMKSIAGNSSSTLSSATNEVEVFSQTIISELSTVRVGSSENNALPDMDNLQPDINGLDIDQVGGSMLTDINDAVLASIEDEQENTDYSDQAGTTSSSDDCGVSLDHLVDNSLVTISEDELLVPSRTHVFGSYGTSSQDEPDSLIYSNNNVQTMTSSREQPGGTPVVILRDILSQVKSVRFDQVSAGARSQSHGKGQSQRSIDICPGKQFVIKEKSDNGEVDIIDQSSSAIIVLETSKAKLAERAKRVLSSKCKGEGKQIEPVVSQGPNTDNTESDVINESREEDNHPSSVTDRDSLQESFSSHSSKLR